MIGDRIHAQLPTWAAPLKLDRGRVLLDTALLTLVWAACWLAVRAVGDGNDAVAAAFVLPVALAGLRFGWHASGVTAIVSALFVGPLSPALGSTVSDLETATFATVFLTVAAAASVVRSSLRRAPDEPEQIDNFGGIARELRTPVQAILGAVEMLDRVAPNDGEERVAVATLGRAAERLHELETLLSAVSVELGTERRADDHTLVDLRLIAGDVAAELRREGGLSRLRFDAAHDADVVMSHPDRVHLLLRCLVGDGLENTGPDEAIDCSVRRDVDTIVVRLCAPSKNAEAQSGRIRLVAAEELAIRLGGTFEAVDAGGASQVTVRLPQRRDTDPTRRDAHPKRPVAVTSDVWTSGATSRRASPLWARIQS